MRLKDPLTDRLVGLRERRGWNLETLAVQSGVSRASLSRIERGETSPTAAVLGKLCSAYEIPMAELFSELDTAGEDLVPKEKQTDWLDQQSGYRRLNVSPSRPGYKGSVIQGRLPAGASVSYADTPVVGLEHHLVLQSGRLEVRVGEIIHQLNPGDCLRFKLNEGNSYRALGSEPASYLLCVIAP